MSGTFVRALVVCLVAFAALPVFAAEGRTPIPFTSPAVTPFVISAPGKYIVTRNLSGGGLDPVIYVTVPPGEGMVDIDLNGMVLDNFESPSPVIWIAGDTTVRNGSIAGGSGGIWTTTPTRRLVVEDVNIEFVAGYGIYSLADQLVVRRSTLVSLSGWGIYAQNEHSTYPLHVTIKDNELRDISYEAIVVGSGRSVVSDNRIHETGGVAIYDNSGCLVSQNTIGASTGDGIQLAGTRGCRLHSNVIEDAGGNGISVTGGSGSLSGGNFIIDNVVHAAALDGIFIDTGANNVERNTLVFNGTNGGFGLHFGYGAYGNTYGRNHAESNNGGACQYSDPVTYPEFCDDKGLPGASQNSSHGDNLMGYQDPI